MTSGGMTYFVAGFAIGAMVFWNVSVATERFRRARADFRATRSGLRTLAEMTISRGWQAIKGLFTAAVVLTLVFLMWRHRGFR